MEARDVWHSRPRLPEHSAPGNVEGYARNTAIQLKQKSGRTIYLVLFFLNRKRKRKEYTHQSASLYRIQVKRRLQEIIYKSGAEISSCDEFFNF